MRVTVLLLTNKALQVVPQVMPTGVLVAVPLPLPDLFTVRGTNCVLPPPPPPLGASGVGWNRAVQVLIAFTTTFVESVVPLQAPLQPEKIEPLSGEAIKTTLVPPVNAKEQTLPQTIPKGLPVTVPPPVPDFVIVREKFDPLPPLDRLKEAVHVLV
jgi:hypothetical protein